jgi:dUTP pyrophosphatase
MSKTKGPMKLKIKKLSDLATVPTLGSEHAAGWDLYSAMLGVMQPGQRLLIKTDIAMDIPPGHYGRICPRSGLAMQHGIDVLAGVIDSDYRGNIAVVLINHGAYPFEVHPGDKVAQIIICPFLPMKIEESQELPETARGDGGFGSTGLRR